MEGDKTTTTMMCTLLAMDLTTFSYRVCSLCERTLPEDPTSLCSFCNFNARSKRLFRILMSLASDTKVFTVICFDRAAKVLFGCSADEFFDFAKLHPFTADTTSRILEGEMVKVTLSKPKNGNAHLRMSQVFPLRTGFRPAIETLKEFYGVRSGC
ncbi:Nucleic acid-binding, OB-fold containing protein [Parasponia andersonii]|uniref:Nucleic acid-binding, OB-fold containing protein n=1 Tax=Parasponia andersonii TaxID=3476 RepID=A0A2P5CZL8_PARAD|nr:Nucleic acid-binding, OB-fold containing protein [Parasponia andersonii]